METCDLDLFIGQWKAPYIGGSMPTPYYNANDGYPDYLLRNEGDGTFVNITNNSGLSKKSNRRTFSASLVDLDFDQDLDLIVVADFSGLDLYINDGKGTFFRHHGPARKGTACLWNVSHFWRLE